MKTTKNQNNPTTCSTPNLIAKPPNPTKDKQCTIPP
jgi:hypothetical protein